MGSNWPGEEGLYLARGSSCAKVWRPEIGCLGTERNAAWLEGVCEWESCSRGGFDPQKVFGEAIGWFQQEGSLECCRWWLAGWGVQERQGGFHTDLRFPACWLTIASSAGRDQGRCRGDEEFSVGLMKCEGWERDISVISWALDVHQKWLSVEISTEAPGVAGKSLRELGAVGKGLSGSWGLAGFWVFKNLFEKKKIEREKECARVGGGAEGEGEAGSSLSREPTTVMMMRTMTQVSIPGLRARSQAPKIKIWAKVRT